MRTCKALCLLGLSWLWLGGVVPAAEAQPRPDPADLAQRVEALASELDALRERAAAIPTLAEAVPELETRLAAAEQRLAVVERALQALPDRADRVDDLDRRVRALAGELTGLRFALAELERPGQPAPGGSVSHDGGFLWRTPDGRHALRISGYVQPRYELAGAGEVERSTLRLRRARLGLAGHVDGERLGFKLLLSGIRQTPLLEYYLDYAVHRAVTVRVGQYKTQISRAFLSSSTRLAFPELAGPLDDLRYDRDLQIGVHGRILGERLGYYAGVGNGAGKNRLDDNLDKALTLRLEGAPLGKRFGGGYGDLARSASPALMLGASVVRDAVPAPARVGAIEVETDLDGDGSTDDIALLSVGVDATLRYRGLEVAAEVLWRREDTADLVRAPANSALLAAVGDRRTRLAAAAEVTYVLPWSILIGGRASTGELAFLGVNDRASRVPAAERLWAVDGLVGLYRDGRRLVGLMYTREDYRGALGGAAVPEPRHRVIAEAQLVF